MENNENPINSHGQGKMRKWYVWLFIALLAALLLSSMAGDTISRLFNSLLAGLTPIIIAVVISFLFLKPISLLENKLMKNLFVGNARATKYKRAISLTLLYLITLGIIILIFVLATPSLIGLVQQFADETQLSQLMEKIQEVLVGVIQFFGVSGDDAVNTANSVVAQLQNYITDLVSSINLENAIGIFQVLFSIIMGFLISFLLLKDKELISKTARRYTYAYYPRKQAEEVLAITHRTNDMLNQYVISTLIVCFTVFVIAWIGYAIMGVPYSFMMALILGVLSIIPYIGGFIAAVPLLMVTLMAGDLNLFLMAFIFGIAEWAIVTTFLPALIMSKRMNTRALVIILALVIGGAMFGVVGMILSAPIASVIMIYMNEKLQVREARREHEELLEAGVIDSNFYDISEMLDLTQDNANQVVFEKEEDDFKKLQATKNKKKETIEENDKKLDIVLKSKAGKKSRLDKKKLSQVAQGNEQNIENVKLEETKKSDDILEETDQ